MRKRDSILDVLDSEGVPTGETVRRGDLPHTGHNHRTAHLLTLFNGSLLMQRVTKNPHVHGSTMAAFVLAGETPLDAILRRGPEELDRRMERFAPIRRAGSFRMPGTGGGTKFVDVFTQRITGNTKSILRPSGIDFSREMKALRRFEVPAVLIELVRTPERYTPTFREVARFLL